MPQIYQGRSARPGAENTALDFAVQSAQKASSLIQNRKQLDLMEEELRQQKWRDLHNSVMELVKNDAMTNQYGWRGAFENSRGVIENLYAAGGMNPSTIRAMFNRIEESGLSPEVAIRASYEDWITSDLSKLSPYDIENSLEKQVKKLAISPEEGYPKQTVSQVLEERQPPTRPKEEMKDIVSSISSEIETGKASIQTMEQQIAGLREQRRKLAEGPQNRASKESIETVEREYEELTGRLQREKEALQKNQRAVGIVQDRLEGITVPKKTQVIEISPREMNQEERKAHREALVEIGVPKALSDAIVKNELSFDDAVREWVDTGEITVQQRADINRYARVMNTALKNKNYASRLREEYETPDSEGITKLQRVMINLGAMEIGLGGTPAQQYMAGVGVANAIVNPEGVKALASKMEADIDREKMNFLKNRHVQIEMVDGTVETLNLLQFSIYAEAMGNFIRAMSMMTGGGGEEGGPLKDMNLDDIQKALREMEREAGLSPDDREFGKKQATLMSRNSQYKAYSELFSLYTSYVFGARDEEGNPIPADLQRQTYRIFKATKPAQIPFLRLLPRYQEYVEGMGSPFPPGGESVRKERETTSPVESPEERAWREANQGFMTPGGSE